MAEWDPLSDPPEAKESGEADGGVAALLGLWSPDGLVPIEGTQRKVTTKDMERTFTDLRRKFAKLAPWKSMPDPRPDLDWHAPACSLDNWKHKDVRVELAKAIAYVTLNRPEDNNRLGEGIVAGLCDAVLLLHSRPDIRVVVFSGEGKLLCGGRDPKGDAFGFNAQVGEGTEALESGAFPEGRVSVGRMLQAKLWHTWAMLPQFTICLAGGSALGDGMGVALCSDMVVAVRAAYFGFPDTKLGLVNAALSPYLLAKTSAGVAKNMFVMGSLLPAETAFERGIVDRVVESLADGYTLIREICEELTKCAPGSVRLAKELVAGVAGRQVDESIIFYTMAMASRVAGSEEFRQGLEAAAAELPKPWETSAIEPLD